MFFCEHMLANTWFYTKLHVKLVTTGHMIFDDHCRVEEIGQTEINKVNKISLMLVPFETGLLNWVLQVSGLSFGFAFLLD